MQTTTLGTLSDLTVRRVTTAPECEAVLRLRYEVYLEEQEKKQYAAADHEHRRLILDGDDDPSCELFVLGSVQRPTATTRLRVWKAGEIPAKIQRRYSLGQLPALSERTVADITSLIVRREHRGSRAAVSLLKHVLDRAFGELGAELLVSCCLERLLPLYRRFGFRPFGAPPIETPDGPMCVLLYVATDTATLRHSRSPFIELFEGIVGGNARLKAELSPYIAVQDAFAIADQGDMRENAA